MGDQVKEEADIVDEQSQDRVQFSLRRLSSYISFFFKVSYEGKPISSSNSNSGQWAFLNYGGVIYIFPNLSCTFALCNGYLRVKGEKTETAQLGQPSSSLGHSVTTPYAHTHQDLISLATEFHMPPTWKSKRVITDGDRVLVAAA